MTRTPPPVSVRALLDAFDQPLALRADDGRLTDVNRAFVEELAAPGATREDVLDPGRRAEVVDESVRGAIGDVRAGVALRVRDLAVWRAGEAEHRRVDLVATPLAAPGAGTLLRFAAPDATSRLRARTERDSRRAIAGALAAGIAHDVNNQLAASMNVAILLSDALGAESEHADALEILVGAAREAAALSRRLLRVVGRVEAGLEELALGPCVEAVVLLLRHELPPAERLSVRVADAVPTIVADPARVEHLVALLALPCADAAGDDGALSVTVREDAGDAVLELRVVAAAPPDDDTALELARVLAGEMGGELEIERGDGTTTLRARLSAGRVADTD